MSNPYLRIIEQPARRSFRFRYESECRSRGTIVGEYSTTDKPTSPQIEIGNFEGPVEIVVSCVTDTEPYQQHPHKLSHKGTILESGVHKQTEIIRGPTVIDIKDIGIVYIKKTDIKKSLEKRKQENIDPTQGGWNHMHQSYMNMIDPHTVRLCFHVNFGNISRYKLSNSIIDKKKSERPMIHEISATNSSALGGEKIILLCDKVQKEDIRIEFIGKNGNWKAIGRSIRVHHQYAITFQTPAYGDLDIFETKKVSVRLYRPSDQTASDPIPFEYLPSEKSIQLQRKRQKIIPDPVKESLNDIAKQSKPSNRKIIHRNDQTSQANPKNRTDTTKEPNQLLNDIMNEFDRHKPPPLAANSNNTVNDLIEFDKENESDNKLIGLPPTQVYAPDNGWNSYQLQNLPQSNNYPQNPYDQRNHYLQPQQQQHQLHQSQQILGGLNDYLRPGLPILHGNQIQNYPSNNLYPNNTGFGIINNNNPYPINVTAPNHVPQQQYSHLIVENSQCYGGKQITNAMPMSQTSVRFDDIDTNFLTELNVNTADLMNVMTSSFDKIKIENPKGEVTK